ncbi:MbcA/ParS/Xre antitoxin family protein [uncultured Ruegeria sp.]|uniref:MbcA/ParS/Xre antitoxin family protein n=1 Tax=uncultured Ruegeria sp. TaxID=259304 RepID=UPI00260CF142|nr:MbcA/ParS/Xre antitoxin family protein [uncultured Ruegeria sp.]
MFHEDAQALQWLSSSHLGTDFAGRSPLSLIIENGQDGMMLVRRYIDAWRGGCMGHGAPEGSFEPVTEEDVVFV